MGTEICTTVPYCNPRMANLLCNRGRWIDSGLSGLVGYPQDADQTARHAKVRDRCSAVIRIKLHSKIRSEIGTWPNGSLYDKTAGWRFQKLYSRQTMLAGLLGEMPFGEFLAAGDHEGGGSHRAAANISSHSPANTAI